MKSVTSLFSTRLSGNVSDKWSLYISEYERLFAPYAAKVVNLLEIGVQNGGSLDVWVNYFVQGSNIVGCDIDASCGALKFDSDAIRLVVGDVNKADTQRAIYAHVPSFDIVIDDGSHTSPDIIRAFCALFGRINDGGLYIVEDLHCSYWQRFGGGLYHPHSAYAFFKALVDVCNHEHWGVITKSDEFLKNLGFDVADLERHLEHIHSVEFLNSMCVVHKQAPAQNVLGYRVVKGSVEKVSSIKLLDNTAARAPDERANPNSIGPPPLHSLSARDLLTSVNQVAQLASLGAYAELFWRHASHSAFSEDRAIKLPWQFGPGRQTFMFTLPPTVDAVTALRLDLTDRPAWCQVHAAWVADPQGAQLWAWRPGTTLLDRPSSDMTILAPMPGIDGLDVLALGFDPRAMVCLPSNVLKQLAPGSVFGLTVTIQLPAQAIALLADNLRNLTALPGQQDVPQQTSTGLASDLADIVDLLRKSLSVRDQTIRQQRLQLQQQAARQDQLHIELIRAEAQLDLLKSLQLGFDSNEFL